MTKIKTLNDSSVTQATKTQSTSPQVASTQATSTQAIRAWVEKVVIGLNLCPFAKREWVQDKVRIQISQANSQEQLLQDLVVELALLNRQPEIETSLLVHPHALQNFDEYNQFLDFADALIEEMALHGVYQIASFHPDYQFDGTSNDDAENYTNRSPHPMLHLLRESSLEQAVNLHPNTAAIPTANIELLEQLGVNHMRALLSDCRKQS